MRVDLNKTIEIRGILAYLTGLMTHISIKSSTFANEIVKEPRAKKIITLFKVWFASRNCVKTKNKKQIINCA